MTAHARPKAVREVHTYWHNAVEIRQEWLDHGLATAPADRYAAETSIANIYARHSRARPHFVWVESPRKAVPLLSGLPTHSVLQQWVSRRRPPGAPPLASDIVAGLSRLRGALDVSVDPLDIGEPKPKRKKGERRPVLPPIEALDFGVPLVEVLRIGIREALFTSLGKGFLQPVRSTLTDGGELPSAWYGQQESYWVAHYDVLRRLGFARYRGADGDQFEDWVTLARTCGWWWPGEDTCVMVERPVAVWTEPVRGGWYGEVRVTGIEYRDGWRPALPTR